jgi:5-methyltetrahydrofolate--homocysteine methyltransferase
MSDPRQTRLAALEEAVATCILVKDSATGTFLQSLGLTEADYRGERFASHPHDLKGNHDILVLTRPEVVRALHNANLEADADCIETDTFTATTIAQSDYGLDPLVREMNREAARIARACADAWTARRPEKPRFVIGSIGPTNRTLSLSPRVEDPAYRAVTFAQVQESYAEQVRGLMEGDVDLLAVETVFDTLNAKACLLAIEDVFAEAGRRLPLLLSVTVVDRSGRTLSGQTVDAFWTSVRHARPIFVCLRVRRELPAAGSARNATPVAARRPAPATGSIRRPCARTRGATAPHTPSLPAYASAGGGTGAGARAVVRVMVER